MKTVGKQLQEARLAKNWTPELAARETKIKVERLKDLESDDFSHFNNATYARGFVRTYARALGLDEYKILRQLDNKLPDDDTANIVSAEGGVAYLPETAMPPRVAHRNFTGLYIVMGLGAAIMLVMVFILFRAYQVGELGTWTGSTLSNEPDSTNAASANEPNNRAKPIDSNTPPPIPEAVTNAVAETPAPDTNAAPVAPVAPPVALPASPTTPTAPVASATPPRALPVDLSALNAPTPAPAPKPADIPKAPLRALPVNPADLNSTTPPPADIPSSSSVAAKTSAPKAPRALPVSPADLAANTPQPVEPASQTPSNPLPPHGPVVLPSADTSSPNPDETKPLVLTASRDSFVRVTAIDTASGDKPVYAAVLHTGQSVGFNGHKFSVNVDNPSAVDIKLDGVNYGPHSDGSEPETFTVVSHVQ